VSHAQFPYPDRKCLTPHFPLVRLSTSISATRHTRHLYAPPVTPLRAPRHLSSLRESVRECLTGRTGGFQCGMAVRGERVGKLQKRRVLFGILFPHPLVLQTVPTPVPGTSTPRNFTVLHFYRAVTKQIKMTTTP